MIIYSRRDFFKIIIKAQPGMFRRELIPQSPVLSKQGLSKAEVAMVNGLECHVYTSPRFTKDIFFCRRRAQNLRDL